MSDIEYTALEMNVFDEEEIYPNCTVQVLRNSITGEVSVGWWKNVDSGGDGDGICGPDTETDS